MSQGSLSPHTPPLCSPHPELPLSSPQINVVWCLGGVWSGKCEGFSCELSPRASARGSSLCWRTRASGAALQSLFWHAERITRLRRARGQALLWKQGTAANLGAAPCLPLTSKTEPLSLSKPCPVLTSSPCLPSDGCTGSCSNWRAHICCSAAGEHLQQGLWMCLLMRVFAFGTWDGRCHRDQEGRAQLSQMVH